MSDRDLQKVLQKVYPQTLTKALKIADDLVVNKIFRNMSKRTVAANKEYLDFLGPARLKDLEESQQEILGIIRSLIKNCEVEGNIKNFISCPPNWSEDFIGDSIDLTDMFDSLLTSKPEYPEKPYGFFHNEVPMCSFFRSRAGENILSDIETKNEEQGLINSGIPNTRIKLINYSVCPNCNRIFSFKELSEYYSNPKLDTAFRDKADQYRRDTRFCCPECGSYFLPSLVISDGTPKNEVQFLCRGQTVEAIENCFIQNNKKVLTKNRHNIYYNDHVKVVKNDVALEELESRPTLISNLLLYTPAKLALNLMDGSNIVKGDILYGGGILPE
ncbi:hypothetical protein LQZ19_02075 [Treponema primitia]